MDDMPTEVGHFHFAPEGRFEITFDTGTDRLQLAGQFLRIQPVDALSFTWMWQPPAPHSDVESLVTVTLAEDGPESRPATRLTLTHSQLDAPGMAERHRAGWRGSFTRLHRYLEEPSHEF